MEELIKRLERIIQTGAQDKNGKHPISAETVLEVVKELSEHGTNLAEVGTDCISRQKAIEIVEKYFEKIGLNGDICVDGLRQLPPIKPDIVKCKDCKYAEYIDDVKTLWCTECGQGRTVAQYDFCSYAEKREVTT